MREGGLRSFPAVLVLSVCVAPAAMAQGGVEPTTAQVKQALGTEWTMQNLAPAGRPVLPIFDGWFENDDGTYELCFGYHNLNLREALDIPLGPDNFIEPARFDGFQPTRFDPVPANSSRRYWCTFTVNVPADIGDQRVVWTLRIDGQEYSVPGHVTAPNYELDEPDHLTRNAKAPLMRLGPNDDLVKGRRGLRVGPYTTPVGQPLELSVWADPEIRPEAHVWWYKHQGPGDVTFSEPESYVQNGGSRTATLATFAVPGSYIVRVKAVANITDISFHCCWTNGYFEVEVTP
jgi:hypothetical protein